MSPARLFTRSLPAFVALSVACSDAGTPPTSVPPPSFDAPHALALLDPVGAVFDQGIFRSFSGAHPYLEKFYRTVNTAPFPAQGATFVYDPGANTYVADPTLPGAPTPGVRFTLYEWDESLGRFTVPLTRVGYVDLTPQSLTGDATQATRVVMVRDAPAATIADFVVAHGVTAGVNVFDLSGFATDGITHVNVTVGGTASGAGAHHLDYFSTLSAPTLGLTADEQLSYDQAPGAPYGKSQLRYEMHTLTDESVGNGSEISFDGALYARVLPAAGGGAVQYLKPDGTPLTQQEAADVEAVLVRTGVVHFFWIDLVWP